MKLLHVNSSIFGEGSVSRVLSGEVVAAQRALHPGIEVTYRDLAGSPHESRGAKAKLPPTRTQPGRSKWKKAASAPEDTFWAGLCD